MTISECIITKHLKLEQAALFSLEVVKCSEEELVEERSLKMKLEEAQKLEGKLHFCEDICC